MSLVNVSQLVLRSERLFAGRRVLLAGAPCDRLAAELPADHVQCWHWDWQHHRFAAQQGWQSHFGITPPAGEFDAVLVFMPKAKARLQAVLQQLPDVLAPGACVYLVGEKREGIDSAGKWLLALANDARKIDRARHSVLWSARVGGDIASQPVHSRCPVIALPGIALPVCFLPGVFSEGRLDEGTALLLQHLPELPPGPVLDFACGSGVISAFILHRQPQLALTAVDSDAFAIASTEVTLAQNRHKAEVLASNGFSELTGRRFGSIVTNPPFHEGIKTDALMTVGFIHDMARHLHSGGELWLVANRFLPYAEALQTVFKTVEVITETGKFRVYHAVL